MTEFNDGYSPFHSNNFSGSVGGPGHSASPIFLFLRDRAVAVVRFYRCFFSDV